MSTEQALNLLATPVALFTIMLLASFGNGLKQLQDAKSDGSQVVSIWGYLAHWPETITTIITNSLAFIMLLGTNQLDTSAPMGLKLAAVIGIGYGLNSLSDLLRPGSGRSASLTK